MPNLEARKLQVFQCKCLRMVTNEPWFVSNRQFHENLSIKFFADNIKALTKSLDSKLPGAGNPFVWLLGRHLCKSITEKVLGLSTPIMEAFSQNDPTPKSQRPSAKIIPTLLGFTPRHPSKQSSFHKGQIS
jgi:hypothetical protein